MTRVVIIGGGAIGSSIAWWLTREPGIEVTVVERDPTYARASSALSCSSIRQQFSTPVNIEIGRFGIGFLREIGRHLAVDEEAPDIGLVEPGYLFLASEAGLGILEENHRIQREHGADVALLTPPELAARLPWLSTAGIAAGSLGLSGEGWFDGYGLLRAFRRAAIAGGARYVVAEAVSARRSGDRVAGIGLADGTGIEGDLFVNAAGPWAGRVAAMLGVELPVVPRARSVFVLDCPEPLPRCPLLIDSTGVWLRPEGKYFITGMSPPPERDPDDAPLEVDHGLFDDIVWPTLAARVPALERLRVVNTWAGYYEYNTLDQNGLVGPYPGLDNVVFANGFSGHGIQQSPAVGRGVAELIVHGGYRTLDLSPLATSRLVEGRRVVERNVV